ncbi:MAG: radical SAM protein [Nitrospirae bacterium]|nr:MAG: radical SAM protein [Nitrospirota bacterium]
MKVCEIFASIQGESSFAGIPFAFVRFSGCNLRCVYCDTKYAYEEGAQMTGDEIFGKVKSFGLRYLEVTGGEPLLQEGVSGLIGRFLDEGFTLLIETNGSVSIREVDRRAVVIMDIKTPSSGMFAEMDLMNLEYLKPDDELKFVIADRHDYEWSSGFIRDYGLSGRCGVLFSPVFGVLNPADLANWLVSDRLPVRFNLQIHKYVFGPDQRGV